MQGLGHPDESGMEKYKSPPQDKIVRNKLTSPPLEKKEEKEKEKEVQRIASENLSTPTELTFLKSKKLGKKFIALAFGNENARAGNNEVRDRLLFPFHSIDVILTTSDNLLLEATLVLPKEYNKNTGKTYIYCSGSFGCYERYLKTFVESKDDGSVKKRGILNSLIEDGNRVLLFDYRGFGKNKNLELTGVEGLFSDAEAAFQYAKLELNATEENIVMFGYSMGGPIAAKVAGDHGTSLVLDRTFVDVGSMAKEGAPLFLGGIAKKIFQKKIPLTTSDLLQTFRGKELKIIIELEKRKDFEKKQENDRVVEFSKVLKELKIDPAEHMSIYHMPHEFNNDNLPSDPYLQDILFK